MEKKKKTHSLQPRKAGTSTMPSLPCQLRLSCLLWLLLPEAV